MLSCVLSLIFSGDHEFCIMRMMGRPNRLSLKHFACKIIICLRRPVGICLSKRMLHICMSNANGPYAYKSDRQQQTTSPGGATRRCDYDNVLSKFCRTWVNKLNCGWREEDRKEPLRSAEFIECYRRGCVFIVDSVFNLQTAIGG